MAEEKKKRGPKLKLKPEHIEIARKAALEGKTNPEIAKECGVSPVTIHNWKRHSPELLNAIKEGKKEADDAVAASLYERAMGAVVKETKVFLDNGQVITETIEKHYPPDTAAAIFWLKNRQPERWRDKQEVEHSGTVALAERLAEARKRKPK